MPEMTMLDYIQEIPSMIQENVSLRKEITKTLVDTFCKKTYQRVLIVASGSSYNASMCARLYMEEVLNIPVNVVTPYTFTNYEHQFLDDTFVLVASQSGNSTNSLAAIEKLKELGITSIGISADDDSDFKTHCDVFINYHIGVETVGFVTKGMVGLVLFFMLFATESAVRLSSITSSSYRSYINAIKKCSLYYQDTYKRTVAFYEKHRHELLSMDRLFVLGSGPAYGVALESALKIGETRGICSFAYETEEFLHGPSFNVNGNYTCLFIDNNDETSARMKTIVETTQIFTDRCYTVTHDKSIKKAIYVPETSPTISVLYKLAVAEYLAYRITNDLNAWPIEELAAEYDNHVRIKSKAPNQ